MSLYWVTASPKRLSTSARDSLLGTVNSFEPGDEALGAAAFRVRDLARTRSAHDFGAARGGDIGLGGSESFDGAKLSLVSVVASEVTPLAFGV